MYSRTRFELKKLYVETEERYLITSGDVTRHRTLVCYIQKCGFRTEVVREFLGHMLKERGRCVVDLRGSGDFRCRILYGGSTLMSCFKDIPRHVFGPDT